MKTPEYASFERISASATLRSLPTLILAMFRATAPAYYSSVITSGNMHMYNDCMYMVEHLRDIAHSKSSAQMLEDCDALERFAKSAYAREMDLQRTVLGDLLDGAQGFLNCTGFPYSAECENAVGSVIDRLRAVHEEWSSILSRSALLQSIGSLLSRVIEKIVKDVEEMEDISEAESQRLTAFCSQISALEDLFLSDRPAAGEGADGESLPLTAVYVPNWLRFQYLSNILESSLVDIKYLWTEGELSLEFSADEVIELIEALFAESSHRRNAIAEIRRSRPQIEFHTRREYG
jgi:protein transport protein DSL1/ZW10